MAKSKTQLMIDGMVACGWVEDPNPRTTKYRVFGRLDVEYLLFVGRSGALRRGTKVSDCWPVTDRAKAAYRKVGERARSYTEERQARLDFLEFSKPVAKRVREETDKLFE